MKSKYRYTNHDVYPRPTSSSSFGTCNHTLTRQMSAIRVTRRCFWKSVLLSLTNGTEFTADTMVEENHSKTTAPTPYTATAVLFSTRSHCSTQHQSLSIKCICLGSPGVPCNAYPVLQILDELLDVQTLIVALRGTNLKTS